MDRREMLGALGLGTASLLAMGGSAHADHEHEHDEHINTIGECRGLQPGGPPLPGRTGEGWSRMRITTPSRTRRRWIARRSVC